MNAPLASDFTGPLYVVIGVGAAIALVGLFMLIAIFMGWVPPEGRGAGVRRAGVRQGANLSPWELIKWILETVFKWVPTKFRFAVALIFIGALIMIVPVAIGLAGNANGGSPTNQTPTATTGTTTGG
jgi:hypothetical protein